MRIVEDHSSLGFQDGAFGGGGGVAGVDWHASGRVVDLRITQGKPHQDRSRPKGLADVPRAKTRSFP
jgi:hypothetical protein